MRTVTPFRFWVRLQAVYADVDPVRFEKRLTWEHERKFNTRMSAIRSTCGWDSDTFKGLFVYCYMYNPINLTNVKDYGMLDNVVKAVRHYVIFLQEHRTELESANVFKVLRSHKPEDVPYFEDGLSDTEMAEVFGVGR